MGGEEGDEPGDQDEEATILVICIIVGSAVSAFTCIKSSNVSSARHTRKAVRSFAAF